MGKKKTFLSTYPKLLSLCISSLFVVCVSHSQPLPFTTLYQQYLPERALENTVHRQNIEEMLAVYARFDPDLIYYACEHLRLKIDNGIISRDSNLANVISSMLKKSRQRRADWVRSQISLCDSNIDLLLKRQSVNSYLSDLEYDDDLAPAFMDTVVMEKDGNRVEFFNLIFFSRNRSLVYDPQENYKQLCSAELSHTIQRYSNAYEQMNNLSADERIILIKSAQEDVLAFEDSYLAKYGLQPAIDLYRFIERAVSDNFKTASKVSLSFVSDVSPLRYYESFQCTDPLTLRYNREFEVKFIYPFNFLVGVDLALKPELEPFSYIHGAIGISTGGIIQNPEGETIFAVGRAVPGIQFAGRYYFDEIRVATAQMIFMEVRSPLLFFGRMFSIELGFGFQHHWTEFSLTMLKDGRFLTLDPQYEYLRANESRTYSRTHDEVYWILSLKFSPLRNLDIAYDVIPPRLARARVGLNIPF